jgi:hypothetical protein
LVVLVLMGADGDVGAAGATAFVVQRVHLQICWARWLAVVRARAEPAGFLVCCNGCCNEEEVAVANPLLASTHRRRRLQQNAATCSRSSSIATPRTTGANISHTVVGWRAEPIVRNAFALLVILVFRFFKLQYLLGSVFLCALTGAMHVSSRLWQHRVFLTSLLVSYLLETVVCCSGSTCAGSQHVCMRVCRSVLMGLHNRHLLRLFGSIEFGVNSHEPVPFVALPKQK